MGVEEAGKGVLRFGVFELNERTGELRRGGVLVKLQPQPCKVLALLVKRPGELVTREEIQQAVWGDETFVDFERGLNFCIKQIRAALGDDAETPRYVETLPRRGYRFLAPVEVGGEAPGPAQATESGAEETPAVPAPPQPQAQWRRLPVWVTAAVLAAILALGGYGLWRIFSPKPRGEKIMLVVLPFENLSNDPEQEYFSEGLTEEMITRLGSLDPERLGVIARTSAMRYKGTDTSVARIGRELGVDYILEGSVRREGDRVAISAQLIQVSDQTHLWAETYERQLSGVLAIQSEVAQRIVHSLALELLPAQQAALARPSAVHPEAYQTYLKGRYYWNKRTPEALKKSVEFFEEAIAQDPEFALAYAGLADSYGLLGSTPYDALSPQEVKPKAEAAARRALELDDTLAEAHTALAHARLFYDWDWAEAESEFQRALARNPGYATARQWYAELLWVTGRPGEALSQIEQALRQDPFSLVIRLALGRHYYLMRQYEQASGHFREAIEMEPAFFLSHLELGLTYTQLGRYEDGIAETQQAVRLFPDGSLCLAGLGYAYARAGRAAEARRVLDDLLRRAQQRHIPALYVAGIYAGLDDKEHAFQWLEKAYQERSSYFIYLRLEPTFDTLRSDPRYDDLLRRLNFPP